METVKLDCGGFCLSCGKRLKTLEGQKPIAYHIKCFNELIGDFNKFDKIAVEKYGYEILIESRTREEWQKSEDAITLHFD